jgi:hypothetical protein
LKRFVVVLALSITSSLANAQGALLETLDDVRGAPDAPASRAIPPSSIEISSLLPPPRQQGDTETCTSWAVTYAAASASLRPSHPEQPHFALSPAFTYPLAGGGRFCRGPTFISKTLDVLRESGTLPLADFAFDPGWCGRQPTAEEMTRALNYRIRGWWKLDARDLAAVKGQLTERRPVIFAMTIGPAFKAFKGDSVFDTLETGAETIGHSMVLVGFDDARGAFRLMNSFGRGWGDNGYAWISYALWRSQMSVGFVIATH